MSEHKLHKSFNMSNGQIATNYRLKCFENQTFITQDFCAKWSCGLDLDLISCHQCHNFLGKTYYKSEGIKYCLSCRPLIFVLVENPHNPIMECEFCKYAVKLFEINTHNCDKEIVLCGYCELLHIIDKVKECAKKTLKCENCQNDILFYHLKHHQQQECQESIIECIYVDVGCKTTFKRKDLLTHLDKEKLQHGQLMVQSREKYLKT